jgi:hypothetical protein
LAQAVALLAKKLSFKEVAEYFGLESGRHGREVGGERRAETEDG